MEVSRWNDHGWWKVVANSGSSINEYLVFPLPKWRSYRECASMHKSMQVLAVGECEFIYVYRSHILNFFLNDLAWRTSHEFLFGRAITICIKVYNRRVHTSCISLVELWHSPYVFMVGTNQWPMLIGHRPFRGHVTVCRFVYHKGIHCS